jgi:FlaA1/EpsC-like NDP-sugar epimerase/dTDP-4-amino-4,6-dideoxygalactose transaminase
VPAGEILPLVFRGPVLRSKRDLLVASFDGGTWLAAVSLWLPRISEAGSSASLRLAALCAFLALASGRLLGLYTSRWEIGEIRHLRALFWSTAFTTASLAVAITVAGVDSPGTAALTTASIVVAAIFGARLLWRSTVLSGMERAKSEGAAIIVFGAGDGGRQACAALLSNPNRQFRPVSILDDDRRLWGRHIFGLAVAGGRDAIEREARRCGAKDLLIAIPSANSELIRDLTERAEAAGLQAHVLPSLAELVGGIIRSADIREVTPHDLLGRRPIELDLEARGSYVTGAVVLVTGAGGSIGSELCRQLVRLHPRTLVMLDRDESALHGLQLSIDGKGQLDSETLVVADIRDEDRLAQVFERWKPAVVFHAAALKHLPLLELHPEEAVKTNVAATERLLELSTAHGVERFVNISTDKAANATSVLGYTKRIAERLTAQAGLSSGRTFLSVRFGNVLGSRGSVLTAFAAQIASGGPVTVTHPEVTRYFMTVQEAVSLVIAAGSTGRQGEVMVLDMGEPVPIVDVAHQLIERSGRQIEIAFTSLRPGEKIHEELCGPDEVLIRSDDGLMWHGVSEPLDWTDVEPLSSMTGAELLRGLIELGGPSGRDQTDGPKILLSAPMITEADRAALNRALDGGWIAPAGPELDAFEEEIADYIGSGPGSVLALSSGSAALQLALRIAGVGPGDQVVVQTATFAASAFAVLHVGAQPVFCDIDPRTGNLDPELLESLLEVRAATGTLPKAVIPVDLYGRCADYARLRQICERFGVTIIQDAAEALGSIAGGEFAGTQGHLGVFSFNGNKIITTGGGGALVGPPGAIARARHLASQAREPALHYEHAELGYNFRLSNLLAALGRAQLQDLERRIIARQAIHDRYRRSFEDLSWFPDGVTERPNHWLNVAFLPEGMQPSDVCLQLQAYGVEARPSWKPMHLQPLFAGCETVGGEVAEAQFLRGICLPSGSSLTPEEQQRVIDALRSVLQRLTPMASTRSLDPRTDDVSDEVEVVA